MRRLFQLDDSHAAVALPELTYSERRDSSVCFEESPECRLERSGSLSVYQSHRAYSGYLRVIKILIDKIPRLVSVFSSQIYFG